MTFKELSWLCFGDLGDIVFGVLFVFGAFMLGILLFPWLIRLLLWYFKWVLG